VTIGESVTIYIKDSVSTNVTIGADIQLRASFFAEEEDCNGLDNVAIDTQPAVGAIDPNDIVVTPEGYIDNDQELIYKIRFQNVGNAMVSTVRIEDKLPQGLDLNSLEVGLTSHNYQFEILENNRLVWTFENINMPDSTTNEPASHGFAIFKIKPKADLEDGVKLKNQAAIFFDNVAPITTNTVTNIIGKAPIQALSNEQLHIFPNPMSTQSELQIVSLDGAPINIISINVFDLLGKKLFEKRGISESIFRLKRGDFPTGQYIIKAVGENGQWYSNKVLIQ